MIFLYSVSKFFNYVKKDTILDWLNVYGASCGFHKIKSEFQQNLFKEGQQIEDKVVDLLKTRFQDEWTDLTRYKFQNFTHYNKTMTAIKNNNPVIYQGLLCLSNGVYGIPDIILRKDVFKRWFNQEVTDEDKTNYIIVDIKKSLKVNKNNDVSKSSSNYEWIQFQLSVYEESLKYHFNRNFEKPVVLSLRDEEIYYGFMDFEKQDTDACVSYYKDLEQNGNSWIPYPKPTNKYMYPNMKNIYDQEWRHVKKDFAYKIKELTLLPYVSVDKRNCLWNDGVFSINDKECYEKIKTVKNIPPHVLEIVKANQNEGSEYNADMIRKELEELTRDKALMYIDLETTSSGKVFLSCIKFNNKYTYFSSYNKEEIDSDIVVTQTKEYIQQLYKDYPNLCVIYYAGSEQKILEIQNGIDLYEVIKKNKYAKHGLYTYALKDIYNNCFRVREDTNICNGLEACVLCEKILSGSLDSKKIEKTKIDLLNYVRKDVMILDKLVTKFLRY